MASPDRPEETFSATAPATGARDTGGLPQIRAPLRVYRPRHHRARVFLCAFVLAAVVVAAAMMWWLR